MRVKTDVEQRKTLALGQLLWSSIYLHNLFSLLLKTNFPVLQEGKEMGLIAVLPGTGYPGVSDN